MFSIFILAFILVFYSDGQRIKSDAGQSTLGLLQSALKTGKEDFKSTGFPTQSLRGACNPAALFLSRSVCDIAPIELSGESQTGVEFVSHRAIL